MRNIHGIVFVWTRTYSEIFKSALVYLKKLHFGHIKSLNQTFAPVLHFKNNDSMIKYYTVKHFRKQNYSHIVLLNCYISHCTLINQTCCRFHLWNSLVDEQGLQTYPTKHPIQIKSIAWKVSKYGVRPEITPYLDTFHAVEGTINSPAYYKLEYRIGDKQANT